MFLNFFLVYFAAGDLFWIQILAYFGMPFSRHCFSVHTGVVIYYFSFYIRMLANGFSFISDYSLYFGRRVVLYNRKKHYLNIINTNV
jgi:hypothetical protein